MSAPDRGLPPWEALAFLLLLLLLGGPVGLALGLVILWLITLWRQSAP